MVKSFIIDGSKINDIPTFYDEINRVFMTTESWKLGQSLDALDDILYGGYGNINGKEEIKIRWKDIDKNKKDLGIETTKAYYQHKLKYPKVYNKQFIEEKLAELENGTGKTYFEIILEIIHEHPNITLVAE